jgi:hypothetical protein
MCTLEVKNIPKRTHKTLSEKFLKILTNFAEEFHAVLAFTDISMYIEHN